VVSLTSLAGLFIGGIIVWLVTALAIFFAGRIVAGRKATYGKALGLILVGVIIISIFSLVSTTLFGSIIGPILVFIVWLALIKSFFHTGWMGALGIAILAVFMMIVIMVILGFAIALVGLPYIQLPISIPTQSF